MDVLTDALINGVLVPGFLGIGLVLPLVALAFLAGKVTAAVRTDGAEAAPPGVVVEVRCDGSYRLPPIESGAKLLVRPHSGCAFESFYALMREARGAIVVLADPIDHGDQPCRSFLDAGSSGRER